MDPQPRAVMPATATVADAATAAAMQQLP